MVQNGPIRVPFCPPGTAHGRDRCRTVFIVSSASRRAENHRALGPRTRLIAGSRKRSEKPTTRVEDEKSTGVRAWRSVLPFSYPYRRGEMFSCSARRAPSSPAYTYINYRIPCPVGCTARAEFAELCIIRCIAPASENEDRRARGRERTHARADSRGL